MSKLPEGASTDVVRATLGKAWNSIDNRFGQLVYDNLFWNKVLKDLGLSTVRALGWNLGTFRELGGGVLFDLPKQLGRAIVGKGFEMSPRMAYTLALVSMTGLFGSIYNYLATGEGPRDLKDMYYPRTGAIRHDGTEDRVSLPTYMKDVVSYGTHPLSTIGHKLAPALNIAYETLMNEDYYGGAIRNEGDPAVQQAAQYFTWLAGQYEPFASRGVRRELDIGAPPATAIQSVVGITPAPASITRTKEQQEQIELRRRMPAVRKMLRRQKQNPTLLENLLRGE